MFDAGLSLNGVKILLVEDNEDMRALTSRVLQRAGAAVAMAADGREGLERALREDYDLVLLDCQLPLLNGNAVARALREAGRKVPLVAFTGASEVDARATSLAAGHNDFLTKPYTFDNLVSVIARHVAH